MTTLTTATPQPQPQPDLAAYRRWRRRARLATWLALMILISMISMISVFPWHLMLAAAPVYIVTVLVSLYALYARVRYRRALAALGAWSTDGWAGLTLRVTDARGVARDYRVLEYTGTQLRLSKEWTAPPDRNEE